MSINVPMNSAKNSFKYWLASVCLVMRWYRFLDDDDDVDEAGGMLSFYNKISEWIFSN